MYKERYEEFQAAVTRSNEVFQRFKSEMEKVPHSIALVLLSLCSDSCFNITLLQYVIYPSIHS